MKHVPPMAPSRRRILTLAMGSAAAVVARPPLSIPVWPLVGAVGFGAAPRVAHAIEPVAMLAVGSAVAGLVLNHNRGDGGMGGLLRANLGYLRQLSQQMSTVQESLEIVLSDLHSLKTNIPHWIKLAMWEKLHLTLGGAVGRFQTAMGRSSRDFGSFQEWREDQNTRPTLWHIRHTIEQAQSELRAGQRVDSLTALSLSNVVFAYLAILYTLGESQGSIQELALPYLKTFESMEDRKLAGSVAYELDKSHKAVEENLRTLKEDFNVVLPEAASRKASFDVRLDTLLVQDKAPAPLLRAGIICPGDLQARGYCTPSDSVWGKARVGRVEEFRFVSKVSVERMTQIGRDGLRSTWRTYKVEDAVVRDAIEVKKPDGRRIHVINAQKAVDRKSFARNSEEFKKARAKAGEKGSLQQALNQLERSVIETRLHADVLAVVGTTARTVLRQVGVVE